MRCSEMDLQSPAQDFKMRHRKRSTQSRGDDPQRRAEEPSANLRGFSRRLGVESVSFRRSCSGQFEEPGREETRKAFSTRFLASLLPGFPIQISVLRRCAPVGRRCACVGRRRACVGRRCALEGRRRACVGRRCALEGRRRACVGRRCACVGRRCALEGRRRACVESRRALVGRRRACVGGRRALVGRRRACAGRRRACVGRRCALVGSRYWETATAHGVVSPAGSAKGEPGRGARPVELTMSAEMLLAAEFAT